MLPSDSKKEFIAMPLGPLLLKEIHWTFTEVPLSHADMAMSMSMIRTKESFCNPAHCKERHQWRHYWLGHWKRARSKKWRSCRSPISVHAQQCVCARVIMNRGVRWEGGCAEAQCHFHGLEGGSGHARRQLPARESGPGAFNNEQSPC